MTGWLRAASTGLVGALLVAVAACQTAPPALPAALVVVDTDLPVPRAVTRLRVDVYDEQGTWLESRDLPLPRPEDWATSFGVASRVEGKDTTVLVRLRAYADGAVRDYRGETIEPRPTFTPPHVASSLEELCANLEELPPFEERTMRRGTRVLTQNTCTPREGYGAGSAAFRVTVPKKDRYRFEVIRSVPDATWGTDTTLGLRTDCLLASSEVGCADDVSADVYLSRLVLEVEPGQYTLVTSGYFDEPADLTLRWAPEAEWSQRVPTPAPPPTTRVTTMNAWPRLAASGVDVTPGAEPLPAAAVDRLVRVHLVSGEQRHVRVLLAGACVGTKAELRALDERHVDVAGARSCGDDGTIGPVPVRDADEDVTKPSAVGAFLAEPCAAGDSDDAVVCVPGGAFLQGSPELDGYPGNVTSALPARIAGVTRFFIDRDEVTVARYRDALARGFPASPRELTVIRSDDEPASEATRLATFSKKPMGRERYPINEITWLHARAFCVFLGGDLPTEAQWEYAAVAAGAPTKRSYPWGEDEPSCAHGVLQRVSFVQGSLPACPGAPEVESIDSPAALADVSPLGIRGLAGNVAEMTRDGADRYDGACLASRSGADVWCDDPTAPFRITRGGSWRRPLYYANGAVRAPMPVSPASDLGFRCAYAARPVAR